MFDRILELCFQYLPCYAPYIGKQDEEWRNKLNILQNYLTLYASRADYEGLPEEFLGMTGKNRMWLLMKFFAPAVCWFKHEANGLQCLPVASISDYNIAGFPTKWKAFTANGKSYDLDENNSVLMFNDYAFSVPFLKLLYNVENMLECDRTHKQNLKAQRQPLVLEVEEDEKKSAQTFINKLDSDIIMVRKREGIRGAKRDSVYNTQAFESGRSFEGDKLASDYRYFDGRNLTMLGYNNENLEKKERLLVDEVNSNNDVVDTFYTTALDCEREAFEQINKKWGYNIRVIPRKLQTFKKEEKVNERDTSLQQGTNVEKRGE